MKLTDLVVTLEDGKRLLDAGIDFKDSCFVWASVECNSGVYAPPVPWLRSGLGDFDRDVCPAPTLAEMLEGMPGDIKNSYLCSNIGIDGKWKYGYYDYDFECYSPDGFDTPVEMLLWLRENKYI